MIGQFNEPQNLFSARINRLSSAHQSLGKRGAVGEI